MTARMTALVAVLVLAAGFGFGLLLPNHEMKGSPRVGPNISQYLPAPFQTPIVPLCQPLAPCQVA